LCARWRGIEISRFDRTSNNEGLGQALEGDVVDVDVSIVVRRKEVLGRMSSIYSRSEQSVDRILERVEVVNPRWFILIECDCIRGRRRT
jgi:hypothetical protein